MQKRNNVSVQWTWRLILGSQPSGYTEISSFCATNLDTCCLDSESRIHITLNRSFQCFPNLLNFYHHTVIASCLTKLSTWLMKLDHVSGLGMLRYQHTANCYPFWHMVLLSYLSLEMCHSSLTKPKNWTKNFARLPRIRMRQYVAKILRRYLSCNYALTLS
jgi:hypothetical protein